MTYTPVYQPRRRRDWTRPAGLLVFALGFAALAARLDEVLKGE